MIHGRVGSETFGSERYFNQKFYRSQEWRQLRDQIIIRDQACDLACPGYDISGNIVIHHINPISVEDIAESTRYLMDPEFLVCVSEPTHKLIHYCKTEDTKAYGVHERFENDQCPWRL